MRTSPYSLLIASCLLPIFVIGCGGGGGTANERSSSQAVVKISALGTPSATPLFGAQATVRVPAGVSVRTLPGSSQTDKNAVVASGNAAPADLVLGTYSAATGSVSVYVVRTAGFAAGEFATITSDIGSGMPDASDFIVTDLIVSDSNGSLITGLTPSISVTFQ